MSILTHERLRHARPVELKRMLEWDIRESAVDTSFVRICAHARRMGTGD